MGAGGNALVSFRGTKVDDEIAQLVSDPRTAGVVFYGPLNIIDANQIKALTSDLTAAAGRELLFAIDQEGGQLLGAGPDLTPFAGNMALGAAGDPDLTEVVAAAIGRELRAVGITVNLAPVADVASRPYNPGMGIRSFGENAGEVAHHVRAFVRGLQSEGVAATLKHFPGKGEAAVDPHDELPVLELDETRLKEIEFPPFVAGIAGGARLLMVGHYGLPAITGSRDLPSSASEAVMRGLIRELLGFEGIIVTDALDMGGFSGLSPDTPLSVGADLLLYGPAQTAMLPSVAPASSAAIEELIAWLAPWPLPDMAVVGCSEHKDLADELARRSITLVRDDAPSLPLRLGADDMVLAIMPQPTDLTPADTSATVEPKLGSAIRRHHAQTTEMVMPFEPTADDVARCVAAAEDHQIVVIGTIDAGVAQAGLVDSIVATGVPTVTVALRTPYDLAAYPTATAHLCTYGILEPTMNALADALFGSRVEGRLPASIPGLYPVGHGLSTGVSDAKAVS